MKKILTILLFLAFSANIFAIDHPGITKAGRHQDGFVLIENGNPLPILVSFADDKAVLRAVGNLQNDFQMVSGVKPQLCESIAAERAVIVGSLESELIRGLVSKGLLDVSSLNGCNEMYLMTFVRNPLEGVSEALVIAGSDRRGTVYGIYELSEQIGVSPWYDWADVPVARHNDMTITRGSYTAGEPAVRYRGIFLNDEAPCLTGWVKHTYGTDYGDHRFYERVFELILRLRGNFIWPAMWGWAFYEDDPLNSRTADEMGIIVGTSHHEPMARNHQEWARRRNEYGVWDYASNKKVIDKFFREGIERAADTEDLITIGMRGDGDTAMGGKEGQDDKFVPDYDYMIRMMQKIFDNQRRIIRNVTGKPASERPQVWALYKEVQTLYEKGLRVPDDVTILLSDDNWGDVRRLPNASERERAGGWGMYYHVDYVGAPRNSKWLNITPVQNIWEQMQLTYSYGVDRLWVLNVGDLKPMEYPITLFLDMAWNPERFNVSNLKDHTLDFCRQQFGEPYAAEAARILNLYSKYNGRITPEMLDRHTYNLHTGEWKQVSDEYLKLEAEVLRQYMTLPDNVKDAYFQLILFPVQAMANLYEMYYAQAMNHHLYACGDPAANQWADKVEACFARDKFLTDQYNNVMAGGKWKNMMIQKHIGYTIWNDTFPEDTLPEVYRIDSEDFVDEFVFSPSNGYVSIEAPHIFSKSDSAEGRWTLIPDMGRTLGGVALMPYTVPVDGAALTYRMVLPSDVKNVRVYVATKSTLAFHDENGHSYRVGFKGGETVERCFNDDLNEKPENIYSIYYPTVARRVAIEKIDLKLPENESGIYELVVEPLDPGIVFEKFVIDFGGYQESYLMGTESPFRRKFD